MRLNLFLAAALAAGSGPAGAATGPDAEFDAHYATARENAGTTIGAAYDIALGAALMASGQSDAPVDACMKKHPDASGALHGYVEFTAADKYQVVLRPQGELTACIESALEGITVPPPPSLPWFNVFIFNIGG